MQLSFSDHKAHLPIVKIQDLYLKLQISSHEFQKDNRTEAVNQYDHMEHIRIRLGTVNSFSQIYFSSKVAVFQTHLYEQVQSRMRSIYLSLTELVHTGSLWRAAACS